jgi:hypothetical protein
MLFAVGTRYKHVCTPYSDVAYGGPSIGTSIEPVPGTWKLEFTSGYFGLAHCCEASASLVQQAGTSEPPG